MAIPNQFQFYQVASSLAQNGTFPPNNEQEHDKEEVGKGENTMLSEMNNFTYHDSIMRKIFEIFHKKEKHEKKHLIHQLKLKRR